MASLSAKAISEPKPIAGAAVAALTLALVATPLFAERSAPTHGAGETFEDAFADYTSPSPDRADDAAHDVDGDESEADVIAIGNASYYGVRFAGRRTASGEAFDPAGLTAAHRSLPFGSKVRVTNRRNGRSVIVRINDRGPYHGNRVIDLSREAAKRIGLIGPGHGSVELALLAS